MNAAIAYRVGEQKKNKGASHGRWLRESLSPSFAILNSSPSETKETLLTYAFNQFGGVLDWTLFSGDDALDQDLDGSANAGNGCYRGSRCLMFRRDQGRPSKHQIGAPVLNKMRSEALRMELLSRNNTW